MVDADQKIGVVTHYYTDLGVGTVKLEAGLKAGDMVRFKGATTDFTQPIASLQFERQAIETASAGQEVGIKVADKVRDGDEVFLVK